MPFFVEHETFNIVYRTYEINSEVIDGIITLIEDTSLGYILLHTPNQKWSYNVTIASEGKIDFLNNSFIKYVNKKPSLEKPQIFYTMILQKDLESYLEKNNYTLVKTNDQVVENIIPIVVKKETPTANINAIDTKLIRDSEANTYKFKSPNQR